MPVQVHLVRFRGSQVRKLMTELSEKATLDSNCNYDMLHVVYSRNTKFLLSQGSHYMAYNFLLIKRIDGMDFWTSRFLLVPCFRSAIHPDNLSDRLMPL